MRSYTPPTPEPSIEELSDEYIDNELIKIGLDPDEFENLTREEREQIIVNQDDFVFDSSARTMTSSFVHATEFDDTETMISLLVGHFALGQYGTIVQEVENIVSRYNLTNSENSKIIDIYEDAFVMMHFDRLVWHEKEIALRAMRHPESFLLGVMHAYPRRREAVILDIGSFSPVSMGDVALYESVKLETGSPEFKAQALYMEDVRNIYRIDFSVGDFKTLYAYVLQSQERVLRISTIGSREVYPRLRTMSWWIQQGWDEERGIN